MPGMTGLELAQVAKARRSDTYVVLMSAEGVSELERQQVALPVDFYLTKPFPLANLTSIVAAVL